MPSLLDFVPLFVEDVDSIRARIDADANAGLDPTDPAFIDTTEGGMYFDTTAPIVLELDRLWDAVGTEYPAAAFVGWAFGPYLDYHGATVSTPRKDAVAATGTVTFTGTVGALIATNTEVSTLQTDPDAPPPVFVTVADATIPGGGAVNVAVAAAAPGAAGNVAAGTVVQLVSPNAGISAVTNAAAITGGLEVETDAAYRTRILLKWAAPQGGGNVKNYESWALDEPGVGYVTVQPNWAGAGTVRVIVADPSNNPTPGAVVTSLQARLDPVAGQGAGQAPIGAVVTVATITNVTVAVSAVVTFASGYSLDGAGGTVATRAAIVASIRDYIDSLNPGTTVYIRHVEARFFSVPGVLDVTSLLLNGAGTNIVLTGLQSAELGTVTLS